MNFLCTLPAAITESMVTTSAVDADLPYNPLSVYNTGDRCTYAWRIWRSREAGVTGITPGTNDEKWDNVGPSNKAAMFDDSPNTYTEAAGELTCEVSGLASGQMTGVLGMDGVRQLTVELVSDEDVTLNSETVELRDWSVITNVEELYFAEPVFRQSIVFTNFSPWPDVKLRLTAINEAGTVRIGKVACGRRMDFGKELIGLTAEDIDYSTVLTNPFGVTNITRRGSVSAFNTQTLVHASRIDMVAKRVKALNSAPLLVVGGAGRFEQLISYGLLSMSRGFNLFSHVHCSFKMKEIL